MSSNVQSFMLPDLHCMKTDGMALFTSHNAGRRRRLFRFLYLFRGAIVLQELVLMLHSKKVLDINLLVI